MAKTDTTNLTRMASVIDSAYGKVIDTTKKGAFAQGTADAIKATTQGVKDGIDLHNGIKESEILASQNEILNATKDNQIEAINSGFKMKTAQNQALENTYNDMNDEFEKKRNKIKNANNKTLPMVRQ
ncbi:hypothetical protein [Helicobacter equorum]|uniref:hypothetical protein n=1 Tax=Helicobacter equorum TaxID=361872 RepID=UPI000CF137B6|nr:hypothetical protein [Helicobacter equorum]